MTITLPALTWLCIGIVLVGLGVVVGILLAGVDWQRELGPPRDALPWSGDPDDLIEARRLQQARDRADVERLLRGLPRRK